MTGVDREAMSLRHRPRQLLQFADSDVDRQTAHLARQVVVLDVIGQMQHRRAVAEVNVMEHPGLFQRVDRPIHRRDVDRRIRTALRGRVQR